MKGFQFLRPCKFVAWTLLLCSLSILSYGQTITFDNVPPLNGTGNTAGGQAFNFTTNTNITIKSIRGSFSTVSGTINLWYNPVKINGAPTVTALNGWVNLGTTTLTGLAASGANVVQTIPIPLSLNMNAGDTFGFMIQWTGNVYPTTNTTIPTFTDGTVTIIADASCAYTSNAGMTTWYNPRQFNGGVVYEIQNKAPNNASVAEFTAPQSLCGSGSHDVKVRVKNTGKNILTSVNVQWSVDGILQAPLSLTTMLDSFGGTAFSNDTIITLGNVFFGSVPKSIVAWTEFPNFATDTVNDDDTASTVFALSMNGTYSIGGATADYTTIADAVSALNTYGVCGPVVFTVDSASGPYTSNLNLSSVSGCSSVNTITFNGNGSIITSATSPVIDLNNVSYITFDRFNITNTGTTGYGVHVWGGSHHLTFTNNSIAVSTTATVTTCGGFIASGSLTAATTVGNNLQYLTFTNNEIIGGYYSFALAGNTGSLDNYGHFIANNSFRDFYSYGLYLGNADSSTIRGNDINRATRATVTTFYGIYQTACRYLKIQQNRIHDIAGTAAYPFYITNCVSSPGYETEISNNAVYNLNNTTTMYGLYCLTTATTGFNIFHNTIQHNATGTGVVRGAFFSVATTNVNFKNNIISITGVGTGVKTGIYVTTASSGFTSDNNDLYVNSSGGTNYVGYWGAVQSTLANWRTASGQDAASADVDPLFLNVANGDLHPTNNVIKGIGAPLGITTDIIGANRPATKPDPGAYESLKPYNDAATEPTLDLISCSSVQDVKVKLVNGGKNAITGVTVNWMLNGILQTPLVFSSTIDTLGSALGNDTTIVVGQIFPSSGIPDSIVVWTSLPNGVTDTTTYNDTSRFVMKSGFAAGTYTIGSGGAFTNITAALTAMANGVCGPVILELQNNYTSSGETFPLVFPSGNNPANTILLRPQIGATALSITGSSATTLIDFNGSKYVTVDGRQSGGTTGELTIENTSATGSTIRLINGASYNAFKHLTIIGNNTTAASGVVFFSTSTGISGNSNNLIDHSNINGNSASVNCIYSLGSAAPLDNTNNTITNNRIYDFFANVASTDISGIALMDGNSNWTIGTTGNGNYFYQTAARTTTSVPALTNIGLFKAIYINSASVGGVSIVGNRIGGNIPGIPGSVFIIGDATTNVGHTLRLIDNYTSSTTVPNSIQDNTISDITLNSTVTNCFIGIHGRFGMVNTGNITGNKIGSLTSNNSINVFFNNTTTGANAYAIRYEAAGGFVQHNEIGGMSAEVRNATGGMQLLVIYLSGSLPAMLTVSDNIVGGSVAHNIQSTATSLGNVNVMGICASGASTSPLLIDHNQVSNLSNLNTTSGTNNGVKGIYTTGVATGGITISNNIVRSLYTESTNIGIDQTSALLGITCVNSSGSHSIIGNTVYGLKSGTPTVANNIAGILVNGTTTSGIAVEKNNIYGITGTAGNTALVISGIYMGAALTAKVPVWNNMISLGTDTIGANYTEPVAINGIFKNGVGASVLYNTVLVNGTGVGSTVNNSYGYNALSNTAGDSVVNNVFVNLRTNSGSGGNHFAIGIPNATNIVANYNLYYVSGTTLGLFNAIAQANLATWQSLSSLDANSVSSTVNFVSSADLHLTGLSVGDLTLKGTPLTYITTDIDNAPRTITPYMGADEGSVPLPVTLTAFGAEAKGKDVFINWTTTSELNSSYFMVMASVDGKSFDAIGKVKAAKRSTNAIRYQFVHSNAQQWSRGANTLYYRLASVDADGSQQQSGIVRVNFVQKVTSDGLTAYPNPVAGQLTVLWPNHGGEWVTVSVLDITGKEVFKQSKTISVSNSHLVLYDLVSLEKGMYVLQLSNGTQISTLKLVKD
jgi:hypothetical protein